MTGTIVSGCECSVLEAFSPRSRSWSLRAALPRKKSALSCWRLSRVSSSAHSYGGRPWIKKHFAIVSGCRRGEWMLGERVTRISNHRNLAYISSSTVVQPVSELSKTRAQQLLHWRILWGSSCMQSCTDQDRTTAGGGSAGGEPARIPMVKFWGRCFPARSLFKIAGMPTMPCCRTAPSRAISCRGCPWCARAVIRICGFLRGRASTSEANCERLGSCGRDSGGWYPSLVVITCTVWRTSFWRAQGVARHADEPIRGRVTGYDGGVARCLRSHEVQGVVPDGDTSGPGDHRRQPHRKGVRGETDHS